MKNAILILSLLCIFNKSAPAKGYSTITEIQWNPKDTLPSLKQDSIFDKVEIPASYPYGEPAWTRYVTAAINDHTDELTKHARAGTYTVDVKFIVMKDGSISGVEALSMKNSKLAKVAVEAIKNSIRWKPAKQNGKLVNAYRMQPFTFSIVDEKK